MHMKYPWIEVSGQVSADELFSLLGQYTNRFADGYLLMSCTDRYVAERFTDRSLSGINAEKLLELRLFDSRAELWLHRSCLADPFSYRLADDACLQSQIAGRTPAFFADLGNYRQEMTQKIDMNTAELPNVPAEPGKRSFYTTGGGLCTLPIDRENAVRLVSYMDYDDAGRVHVCDFRVSGFVYVPVFPSLGAEAERRFV